MYGCSPLILPLTHNKVDSTSRIASSTDPPLEPIDNDLSIFSLDGKFDVRSIGRSYIAFCHGERGSDLAI